ncbi:hypothetical protein AA958_24790 [Streptomyces sp. CNQ-509]|nr:hypothetical protein AA958_24790 [Streptomyces sp. CNQ-509]
MPRSPSPCRSTRTGRRSGWGWPDRGAPRPASRPAYPRTARAHRRTAPAAARPAWADVRTAGAGGARRTGSSAARRGRARAAHRAPPVRPMSQGNPPSISWR